MTDIHADGPAEDVTRPADRADIARLDGRIDRSDGLTARLIETIRAEARADRAEMRAEFRDGIGKLQASVDQFNKWRWTVTGAAGLVGFGLAALALLLRFWMGG